MIGLGRTMPPRAAAAAGPACRVVVWFRGADLRVDDNPALADAARRVRVGEASEVVPVFCYDPRWFKETRWATGHGKTGNHRSQFLLESVAALKAGLRAVGSDLVVAAGAPEAVLPALAAGGPVLAAAEAAPEERGAEAAVSAALTAGGGAGKLVLFWMSTLYHLDDLPYSTADLSDMPDGFTAFKNKVEAKVEPRAPLPPPAAGALPPPRALAGVDPAWCPTTLAELAAAVTPGGPLARAPPLPRDARAALDFRGGEPAALARLRYYLWDTDLVATYFDTRNEMLGGDGSTKFAPWLSHGCLSPRRIAAEVRRYEAARGGNKSTYWVIFELTWRDFFRFQALKHGGALFAAGGPAGAVKAWAAAPALLARWREGRTGWPLVDANMRELAATGWMSNRGRQNVASALALDLGLDWRAGADWFETLLLDYDPASNWGNWAAAAGVLSSDQRVNRFNLVKQAKDYDPRGEYLRHWLPELANVPAPRIFEPWTMSRAEQEQYRCQIGVDYPAPPAARELAGRAAGAPAPRFGGGGRGGGGRGGGRGGGGGGGGGARDEGRGDGRGGGRGGERRRDAGPKGRRGDD